MAPPHEPNPKDRICLPLRRSQYSKIIFSAAINTTAITAPLRKEKSNSHLMPMHMPRMARGTQIINHNPHSRIRAHVINVPIRIPSRVANIPTLRQQQNRISPVRFERAIIDSPDNMTRSIDREVDIHRDGSISASGRDGEHWHRFGEGIVETGGCGVYLGDRGVAGGGDSVCVFIVDDSESVGLVGGFGAGAG